MHTCLSIWFSFCNVESLSSSSEFFSSKSFTFPSSSFKYAFFLSLACWAETLFLSNLQQTTKLHKYLWSEMGRNLAVKGRTWPESDIPLQSSIFFVSWVSPSLPLTQFCWCLNLVRTRNWAGVSAGVERSGSFAAHFRHLPYLIIALHP